MCSVICRMPVHTTGSFGWVRHLHRTVLLAGESLTVCTVDGGAQLYLYLPWRAPVALEMSITVASQPRVW
jgi:hypothetical protein